ncbi:MAG: helix-turn-helix transcriptional regulator [Phycisphaerae bacterium]
MLAEVENKRRRNTGTLTVNGKTFVLVPASEYRALIRRETVSDAPPPKPTPLANGNYDAIATMRAMIARDLIRDRREAKLSQRDLALAAKVPQSTVARIESGKFSPRPGTLKKLYSVMR